MPEFVDLSTIDISYQYTEQGYYQNRLIFSMGVSDVPGDHFGCFFEHCSKGGVVKPMFKNLCCKFGIILEAIWQYKLT